MARDTVTVPREVLANAVSELKSLLAMCEGEVPSLLEDHFSYPKIVDAIEAGETALSSSDPEGGARGERDGGNDVRWAVNYLLEQIAAKFEAWDTMDLWRSDAASLVRSFKHDLTRTPPAGHDDGNLRSLAEQGRIADGGQCTEQASQCLSLADFDHLCTDRECPIFGQRSCSSNCRCHKTREQMMLDEINRLRKNGVRE